MSRPPSDPVLCWVDGWIVLGATVLAGYVSDQELYAMLVGEMREAVANDNEPEPDEPLPA